MNSELMPRISDEALRTLRDTVACSVKGRGLYLEEHFADDLASVLRELEERRAVNEEDARRAEIGALVERIVEAAPGLLTIGRTAMTDGVTIYSAWSSKPFTDERSLLDALRALAAEIGGGR